MCRAKEMGRLWPVRRVGGPIPGTPPEWPAALNLTPDEELRALWLYMEPLAPRPSRGR